MAADQQATTSAFPATLARVQALLYIVTGFWPVLHMSSFEWVTGPKRDDWLVKTVGALLGVVGLALLRGQRRVAQEPELPLVAVGVAGTLATVDIVYYRRGILRWVYLVDAAAEIALVAGWLVTIRRLMAKP